MISDYKTELIDKFKSFYSPSELELSSEIFDLLKSLKLDDKSAAIGFLLNGELTNDSFRKAVAMSVSEESLKDIELLRRIGTIAVSERKKNIVNLRKHFIDLSEDISVIIIKLAERLASLRLADRTQSSALSRLAEECLYFYSPIAQMLGIRKLYTEMEDISFRTLFPKDFNFLQTTLNRNMPIYNAKIEEMKGELEKMLEQYKITARLQWRIKRPYSIYRKLVNQKTTFENVSDILALRVISNNVENCYLMLGIVHSKWTPIDGRFRDWVTFPKANGYRSIQTTVHTRHGDRFEIQIRTEEMHEEAEYGASAHWAYKQGSTGGDNSNWLKRLHDFLDNDEYFENPFDFFNNLKSEMKRDHINVLTPKGEIISLPEGSTTIDYAFAVHTGLGCKITGAKINGKLAKLKTELKSGDVIEVISNPNAKPSRDWLNIVKTTRARSKILKWFKTNEKDLFIQQGRNAWDKLKDQYKKKLQSFEDEAKLKKNLIALGYFNYDDFFYAISAKSIKCSVVLLKKLYPAAFEKSLERKKASAEKAKKLGLPQIRVEGLEHIEIKLSKCCNPIKGEPILAYITKKSEMKIHSINCSFISQANIVQDNLKKAEWLGGDFTQQVRFRLYGERYGKMLSVVVDACNESDINILSTNKVDSKANYEILSLELEVKDILQLETFLTKIRNSKAVESIKAA